MKNSEALVELDLIVSRASDMLQVMTARLTALNESINNLTFSINRLDQLRHAINRLADNLTPESVKIQEAIDALDGGTPLVEVKRILASEGRRGLIPAVKRYRELTGKDLKTAKEFVDSIRYSNEATYNWENPSGSGPSY